jgi:glc operon protein GlcG
LLFISAKRKGPSFPLKTIAADRRNGLTCLPQEPELTEKKGGTTMPKQAAVRLVIGGLLVAGTLTTALAQMPNPYGAPISLENAKKAAAPALAEAEKNHWNMAVAIVDPSGNLVYYEKMDNTQLGSANVAIDKARSAALYKRPTKALQDALAAGGDGLRILRIQGAVPVEGGIPLVMDGKIVGAIGVSGASSAQDAQCAKAGADAIK